MAVAVEVEACFLSLKAEKTVVVAVEAEVVDHEHALKWVC